MFSVSGCATVSTIKVPPRVVTTKPAVVIDQKEIDSIIAVFSESIKKNPGYAGAYYTGRLPIFIRRITINAGRTYIRQKSWGLELTHSL